MADVIEEVKINKSITYYYKHREEILAKKKEKRLADPEAQKKYEERQCKKAERDKVMEERAKKREIRRKQADKVWSAVAKLSGQE